MLHQLVWDSFRKEIYVNWEKRHVSVTFKHTSVQTYVCLYIKSMDLETRLRFPKKAPKQYKNMPHNNITKNPATIYQYTTI